MSLKNPIIRIEEKQGEPKAFGKEGGGQLPT